MRVLALAIPVLATLGAAAPASAQTYNPNYPICLQVWGPLNYYECRYTSMPQCNMSASGRAAQCIVNPYFAYAGAYPPRRDRRHRGQYQDYGFGFDF